MRLIDFDEHFASYMKAWLDKHEDDFETADELEAQMPALYEQFLDTPADWLEGQKPGAYFDQWEDAELLTRWIQEYLASGVSLPDMLLNRVAALGESAAPSLMAMLLDEVGGGEKRMLAISLLREIGSLLPMQCYIDWQYKRRDENELCDNALESLEQMGEEAAPAMLEALEGASPAGQEALLSVLSRCSQDDRVLERLLMLFESRPERRGILAAYLSRLNDPRALPSLMAAAQDEQLKYLDYIEIRSAIESLGGEAPVREFYDDAEYEALFGLKDQ